MHGGPLLIMTVVVEDCESRAYDDNTLIARTISAFSAALCVLCAKGYA